MKKKKLLSFLNVYKKIYGGNVHLLQWICKIFGFNINQKIVLVDLYTKVSMVKFLLEFDFNRFDKIKQLNISKLIECSLYKGRRHVRNLPVNGQRTHTNARTRKKRRVN